MCTRLKCNTICAEQALADELIAKAKMTLNPNKDIPDLPKLKGKINTLCDLSIILWHCLAVPAVPHQEQL